MKSLLSTSVILIIISLFSCKKSYTCRCEHDGWGGLPTEYKIKATSKKNAITTCDYQNHRTDLLDAPHGCELK